MTLEKYITALAWISGISLTLALFYDLFVRRSMCGWDQWTLSLLLAADAWLIARYLL